MSNISTQYDRIHSEDSLYEDHDSISVKDETSSSATNTWRNYSFTTSIVINIILGILSISILVKESTLHTLQNPKGYENYRLNRVLKSVSSYSPIFDLVDLSPYSQKFNGHLHDNSSIFRADPSTEVDAAWDYISTEGLEIITVSSSALQHIKDNISDFVRAPESWGSGSDTYIAQIDVFHQIHCLNELRKEIFSEYYYRAQAKDEEVLKEHRMHKKHCVHILLQNILCHSDVDIIPHRFIHSEGGNVSGKRPYAEPFADFSIEKQCRDFGALLDWARRQGISDLKHKWKEIVWDGKAKLFEGDGYF